MNVEHDAAKTRNMMTGVRPGLDAYREGQRCCQEQASGVDWPEQDTPQQPSPKIDAILNRMDAAESLRDAVDALGR